MGIETYEVKEEKLGIEDTKVWLGRCPTWCDRLHVSPGRDSKAHMSTETMLKILPRQGAVRLRKKVMWLLPGESIIVAFWSGNRNWKIEIQDNETLDHFFGRAAQLEEQVKTYSDWLDRQLDSGQLLSEIEDFPYLSSQTSNWGNTSLGKERK